MSGVGSHVPADPATILQDALDAVPHPFFTFEPIRDQWGRVVELRYTHINRAGCLLYGRPAHEIVGHGQLELFPSVIEIGLWSRYLAVLETGVTDVIDLPWFRENGVEGSFELVAARVGDTLVVSADDVTDRNAMREALAAAGRPDVREEDQLTGLASRPAFLGAIEAELVAPTPDLPALAVVIIDVDDFRVVNESLGQRIGDAVLRGIAGEVASRVPRGYAARLGDDEFALLLREHDAAGVTEAVATLCQRLSDGVEVGARRLSAAVSAGVALAGAGSTADSLVAGAEEAMGVARRRGGNQWVFGQASVRDPRGTLVVEAGLREALRARHLDLHFQPVHDLATGQVLGLEALCRWRHPQWGMIPPAEFVAVAERRNLIGQLGDWVLDAACRQLARWHEQLGAAAPPLAINVSMRQLVDPSLRDRLARLVDDLGIPVQHVCLELTESQILAAGGIQYEQIVNLHHLGVRLAVDDFGAGYSGFGYLRRLPVDVLKIDRSFIEHVDSDPTDAAIVAGMVTLGHSLGLQVIAEGIETAAQMAATREIGADAGQGWFWSPARPAQELVEVVGQRVG